MMIRISSFWSVVLIGCVFGQNVPISPCPDIFSYQNDGRSWKGLVTITRNLQQEQEVKLSLELSVRGAISDNAGKIELINSLSTMLNDVQNNVPINYNIIFPTQSPLPIITSIKDNGQRLCSGQPLQAYPGGSTTTLTLQHTLKLPQVNYNYREPVYQPQSVYSPPPPPYQPTQTERPYNQPPVYQPPVYQPPQSERPIYQPVYQPPQSERPINQPPVYQPPQPERPIYQPVQPTRQQPVRTTTTYRPPVTRPTAQTVRPPQRQTTTRPRESSIPSFDTNNVQCGLPALGGSLSFGAQNINRGEWPWIVAIFIKTKATGLDFICGGTLVSNRHVISAAHCIKQKHNEKEREPNRVVLFVGKHDLENLDESEYQEVRVERFIIHPDWKVHESKYDADIAIILTETYVKYNQWVRPICLWPDNNLDLDLIKNKNGTIVGWGQTEVDNHHSQVPQLIEIPAKTNGDCVLSHTSFQYIISDRTFCAGNKKEIGPCNGDSGSGFVMYKNNAWRLRGIVSNSLQNPETRICDVTNFAVFTDVPKFSSWINNNIEI